MWAHYTGVPTSVTGDQTHHSSRRLLRHTWPELKMLGCVAIEKQGIRNACEYKISAVNETTVTLKDGPTLTHEQASEWLRLPFARTYASIQGLELDCSLGLHDLDCSHFTLRHLYVALSRAKTAALVRCF